jgi:hypothetical protein
MSSKKDVEAEVKRQLKELENLAVTRYTDYYTEDSETDTLDKYTLVNDFLHNSELQTYYELESKIRKHKTD